MSGQLDPFPGGLWKARNRAGVFSAPHQISKTTNCSDKRQTALDSSLENLQLLYETFSGQVNIEVTSTEVITNNIVYFHNDLDR